MQTIKQLNETEYHSQAKSEVPLFSYSTAKTILQKSPLHAYMDHPKLGGMRGDKQSKTFDIGNIIHKMLLGEGAEICVIDANDFRSKEARESKELAYADNQIPILKREYDELLLKVDEIKNQIKAIIPEFFGEHDSELSVYWEMNNGVKCQSRFDYWSYKLAQNWDIKTTQDASYNTFQRQIDNLSYDLQACMYVQAAETLWPELAGKVKYGWIAIELEPYPVVAVYDCSDSQLWTGEQKMIRASNIWEECLRTGNWPAYKRQEMVPTTWAIKREQELIS